ncbi:hypothetical protein FRB91_003942, partial [Serendipita sp. 411]
MADKGSVRVAARAFGRALSPNPSWLKMVLLSRSPTGTNTTTTATRLVLLLLLFSWTLPSLSRPVQEDEDELLEDEQPSRLIIDGSLQSILAQNWPATTNSNDEDCKGIISSSNDHPTAVGDDRNKGTEQNASGWKQMNEDIRSRDEGLILGFETQGRVFSEESGTLSHSRPLSPPPPPPPSPPSLSPLPPRLAHVVTPFSSLSFGFGTNTRVGQRRRRQRRQETMDSSSQSLTTLTDTQSTISIPSSLPSTSSSISSIPESTTSSLDPTTNPTISTSTSTSALATSTTSDGPHNRTEFQLSTRATVAIVSSILGTLLVLCLCMFCRRRKRARQEKQTTIRMYAEEWRLRDTTTNASAGHNHNNNNDSNRNSRTSRTSRTDDGGIVDGNNHHHNDHHNTNVVGKRRERERDIEEESEPNVDSRANSVVHLQLAAAALGPPGLRDAEEGRGGRRMGKGKAAMIVIEDEEEEDGEEEARSYQAHEG